MILVSLSGGVPKIAYTHNDNIFSQDMNKKFAQLFSNVLAWTQGYLVTTNFVISGKYRHCTITPIEVFGQKL